MSMYVGLIVANSFEVGTKSLVRPLLCWVFFVDVDVARYKNILVGWLVTLIGFDIYVKI